MCQILRRSSDEQIEDLAMSGRPSLPASGLPLYHAAMLSYIWFGLMAIALVVAAVNGTAGAVSQSAVESAGTAVQPGSGARFHDE